VAASLLNAIGLSELITHSLEEYESLALRLATDCSLLGKFRDRLEHNRLRFPLFDSDRFCRHIECATQQCGNFGNVASGPEVSASSRTETSSIR
jgi:predicted O-linked N-acetylglucosamine transferase (SPINDLY family)